MPLSLRTETAVRTDFSEARPNQMTEGHDQCWSPSRSPLLPSPAGTLSDVTLSS